MKSLVKDLIIEAKERKKVVSLSLNQSDPEKVVIGFVEGIDNNFIKLKEVSPEGLDDGISIHNLNDIYSASFDDRYSRRLEFLINNRSKNYLSSRNLKIEAKYDDMILNILNTALKAKCVLTIGFVQEYTVTGYVKRLSKKEVVITCIGYEGDYDGISSFLISDIDSASLDSLDNRKTELYFVNNKVIYKESIPSVGKK